MIHGNLKLLLHKLLDQIGLDLIALSLATSPLLLLKIGVDFRSKINKGSWLVSPVQIYTWSNVKGSAVQLHLLFMNEED